jgi:SAM-dependent methyltransferase
MPWGQQDYRRFIPPLTWQCRPQVRRVVADQPPGAVVVDLGAGGRRIAPKVITVDFLPVPGVDLVADVSRLPFADGSVDLAIATGVIEHLADERAFMAEIARIVRKGGIVHLEVPFLQQYHEDPIDCRRLTAFGLERLAARYGFTSMTSGAHIGPTVALVTMLAHYAAICCEGPTLANKLLANGVFFVLSAVLYPLKFLDYFVGKKKNAHQIASGVFCTARKA